MKYEVKAISYLDSFAKPPAGRIGAAVLSAIALVATLIYGLPLSPGGGSPWTIMSITIFSCALVWSTIHAVMSSYVAPNKPLKLTATTFFVIGTIVTILALTLIAIGVLILYVGFKVVRYFMESDEGRMARKDREERDKALEAQRAQEAILEKQKNEEEMLKPFGLGMRCRNCGKVVSKEATYCPECGGNPQEAAREIASRTTDCLNCGHTVSKEATFCPGCGGNPQEAAREIASRTTDCLNCGHTVSKEATFCPGCGGNPQEAAREIASRTTDCLNCGHTVSKEATFCPGCGGNPRERSRQFTNPIGACPACGHEVNKDANRCPNCDQPVEAGSL